MSDLATQHIKRMCFILYCIVLDYYYYYYYYYNSTCSSLWNVDVFSIYSEMWYDLHEA